MGILDEQLGLPGLDRKFEEGFEVDKGMVEGKGGDVLDGRDGYPALVPFDGGEVFEGAVLAVVQGFDLICFAALPDRCVVDLCPSLL
jgi:hypothetical protein